MADDARLQGWGYGEGAAVVTRRGDDGGEDNSLRQLVSMLLRRRALLLATIVIVLAVTGVYMLLTPPVYQATATLQIHAVEPNEKGESSLVVKDMSSVDRSFGTQLTIIKSDQVKRGALQRVSQDVRAKLNDFSQTSIQPVGETNLIEIKVASHDRYASTQLANAYCDEYIQLSRAENRGRLQTALNYVADQKQKVGSKLTAARDELQRFKEHHKIIDVTSEAAAVTSAVSSLRAEQEQLQVAKAEARAELQQTSQLIPQMKKFQVLPGSTVIRPEVNTIKSEIVSLQIKRLDLVQRYRPDRPEVQAVDEQLAALQQRLKSEAQTEINSWSNTLDPIRSNLEGNLVQLQMKDWAMQAKESALNQAAVQADAKMAQLPAREREMSEMTLNLTALEGSFSALNAQQEALRMTQEARVANATKLFSAEPPRSPTSRLVRTLASAFLIGLLLALALAALVDWLDDGVYGEAEAKMVSQLPVLAQIPEVSKSAHKSLMSGIEVTSDNKQIGHLRENFRMLRTMIALASAPEYYALGDGDGNGSQSTAPSRASGIRSVVLTSSLPNEGKTISSLNLALAAALSGEQVILVDCDLRHPNLHRFFDLINDVGLTNVVSGFCTLEEALQETNVPNLRVLTSGPVMLDPLLVLNSPAARICFEQMQEIADFVVIDTPPALVFAEAQVIAAMTDATLLVISSADAKKREVARTRELFDQTGLVPLGTILNKIPPGADTSYTRYYLDAYAANAN